MAYKDPHGEKARARNHRSKTSEKGRATRRRADARSANTLKGIRKKLRYSMKRAFSTYLAQEA